MKNIKLTNGVNFNGDHYRKVRQAREAANLPTYKDFIEADGRLEHGEIPNHPLLGRRFELEEDGEVVKYIMERVCMQYFDGGFYLMATPRMEGTKSHGYVVFDNVNSTNPSILAMVKDFKEKVRWID